LPIAVAIDRSWKFADPVKKRLWVNTNVPQLRQVVKKELSQVPVDINLRDRTSIDEHVGLIIRARQAGIDAATPWSDPSSRSISGFTHDCKEICTEV
jgi:hypothetical protein